MNKIDGFTKDITKENIEKLKELFPTAIKEGKIDVEELERLLGEDVASGKEQYSFTWNGKAEAEKLSQKRTTATLIPCEKESKNWDTTKNLYIEGDNLEVLRVLQNSYSNQIKMIYIDPPYNTGNDFVYKDDFADNMANYKEITGQATKSNAETQGRYHTNWLNMMYPRLKLARQLLKPDGVIFISIDDNEQANLKKLCDEIFGEDNFIANFIWKKKNVVQNDALFVSTDHEYLLCYTKNSYILELNLLPRTKEQEERYSNPDNDPKGNWTSVALQAKSGNSTYEITFPNGVQWKPVQGTYPRLSKDSLMKAYDEGRIWFGKDGNNVPRLKKYLTEVKDGIISNTVWLNEMVGSTQLAKENLKTVLKANVFDTPKPIDFIKRMMLLTTDKDSTILDFFSGSATTAHAVMQLNAEDGGNRKFICVQLPELTDVNSEAFKAGYRNICEIGKERIRRAGDKIREEIKFPQKQKNGIPLSSSGEFYTREFNSDEKHIHFVDQNFLNVETGERVTEKFSPSCERDKCRFNPELLDIGFKVFKLETSNLKKWDNAPTKDENVIRNRIQLSLDYIVDGRTDLDLVYEVMLKYGIDITFPISEIESEGKKAYIINASDYQLFVCCAPQLSSKAIDEFANLSVGTYIFADRCFATDNDLVNTAEILKSKNKEMRLF